MLALAAATALLGCRREEKSQSGDGESAAGPRGGPAPVGVQPGRRPTVRPPPAGVSTPRTAPPGAGLSGGPATQAEPRAGAAAGETTRPDGGDELPVILPPVSTQPAAAPPVDLDALPPPAVGQFAVYRVSAGGGQTRLKQAVTALGPGPNDAMVSEQLIVNDQPAGTATTMRIPRVGRRWPSPMHDDIRSVSYGRERVELAGRALDCIVLTIESRSSAGSLRVERQWISPQVPVTHLVRLVAITDGREVLRQELVDFGLRP